MQCALTSMLASAYRPSTNAPGHPQTMIQSLPLTLGVSNDSWLILDALRKKRNLSDYMGVEIESAVVEECIAQAQSLSDLVQTWLKKNHPHLIEPNK